MNLRHILFIFVVLPLLCINSDIFGNMQDQTINQAQVVLNNAHNYVGRWDFLDYFRPGPLEERHVHVGAGITAFSAILGTAATWPSHGFFDNSFGDCVVAAGIVFGLPAFVYASLSRHTTKGTYARAVSCVQQVVAELQDDDFFNGTIGDEDIAGFVLARFGFDAGVVKIHEHYHRLYNNLQYGRQLLVGVLQLSKDEQLLVQCKQLSDLIHSMSLQLMKKLAILHNEHKDDYKEQVEQLRKAVKEQQSAQQLAADRAVAQVSGTFGYQVVQKVSDNE